MEKSNNNKSSFKSPALKKEQKWTKTPHPYYITAHPSMKPTLTQWGAYLSGFNQCINKSWSERRCYVRAEQTDIYFAQDWGF